MEEQGSSKSSQPRTGRVYFEEDVPFKFPSNSLLMKLFLLLFNSNLVEKPSRDRTFR